MELAGGIADLDEQIAKLERPCAGMAAVWQSLPERLRYICDLLGLIDVPPDVHYQLLHRSASALVEAERFDAKMAGMIVHSFSPKNRWRAAFDRFVDLLGGSAESDDPIRISVPSGKTLMLGWASGSQEFRRA
ncbi:MAG: hypothetical protein ABR601_09725 [Parasphingopyxis sp.]|nr:hypothetical protein [Sphingomonadales bacterium]